MKTKAILVRHLQLDKNNFRTVPQKTEIAAIHALIAIDTSWFWALVESLIDDGYLPTENIIVLDTGKNLVKEGNRRVAALKLIHGLVDRTEFTIPLKTKQKLSSLRTGWKKENEKVPCTIYPESKSDVVDRIVSRTHGKGEQAGRAKWKAVARARHDRDQKGSAEPGLDLLEKFLNEMPDKAKEKELWAGDYPLSVLDEAIKKLAPRLGFKSARALSNLYPKLQEHKKSIDKLINDIGTTELGFKEIRNSTDDFGVRYGAKVTKESSTKKSPSEDESKKNKSSGEGSKKEKTESPLSTESEADRREADPGPKARSSKDFVPSLRLLHPAILQVSEQKFNHGHYSDSVLTAFLAINMRVKAQYKKARGKELDGAALMTQAFSMSDPVIKLGDLGTESGKGAQQGYMQIFAGSMTGIRNPKAHEIIHIDSLRAVHFLFLASLEMYKLDEAGVP